MLVFFALSGFMIYEAAGSVYAGNPGPFLVNRLLRIAPQFLAALLISIALYAVFGWAGVLQVARDCARPGAGAALTAKNIALNLFGFLPFGDRAVSYNFLPIA